MPYIISEPNRNKHEARELSSINYEYDYPEGLDLRPGSDLHEKIKDEVYARALESHLVTSNRFDAWNEIDKVLTSYISQDEEEQNVKDDDPRKPTSIIYPYSYAILDTLLAYMMKVFLQDPIFRFEGTSPEDVPGAILMEKLIQKQTLKTKVSLNLQTFFRDCFSYGIGYVSPDWDVRYGTKRVMRTGGKLSALGRLIGRVPEETSEPGILFEGNSLNNINPYMALPDPGVASSDIQSGDFFGWIEETSLLGIMEEESTNQDYFNAKYLKHITQGKTSIAQNEDEREINTTMDQRVSESVKDERDVIHMYMKLIPSEWKLGDSEYPEKWLFSVGSDAVVLRAKPLGLNHGMYPVAAGSPDFDGYSSLPIGRMETLYGLQHTSNWLVNSHITNVRKAINDMFVVDPHMINMNDMKSTKPGKLIRLRRAAWGRGVRDAVMQLGVSDVTRQNISDLGLMVQAMNHVSGVDESMMGSLRQGGPERLTAGEFQGTRTGAVNRLERMAQTVGVQALQDIGYMFASHAQQLMSEETYIDITGRWEETLRKEFGITEQNSTKFKVSPSDINIDYDIDVKDGSIPGNNFSQNWIDLFQIIGQNESLQAEFDTTRIFQHIARNLGAKNVNEFKRKQQPQQPTVMPDEEVRRQAEAGNIVPQGE